MIIGTGTSMRIGPAVRSRREVIIRTGAAMKTDRE